MRTLFRLILLLFVLAIAYVIAERAAPKSMASLTLDAERAMGGFETKRLHIDGLDISYLDTGPREGEPLLALHGFGADKDHFAIVGALLRGTGRIVAIDFPGFGDSSKPDNLDYSIEAQAGRLAGILDALNLPRAHVAGSSMGGAIAMEFARQHPDRVSSLWLLAPAGVKGAAESEMARRYHSEGRSPLIAEQPAQFAELMQLVFSRPPPLPYSVSHELALAAAQNYSLHKQIFDKMFGAMPALEESAASVQIPALIVWGQEDRVLDVSGAQILHRALQRSTLIVMPGIGHLPMLEDPWASARDYRKFRETLKAGQTAGNQ